MSIKKILAIILSLNLIIPTSLVFSADADTVRWVIDDSNVVREIGSEMYGVNMEWRTGLSPYSQIQDQSGNIVLNPTFPEKYGDLLKFARKAGSSANNFIWKDSLGEIGDRKNQKIWGVTGKVYEGLGEWLEILYAATESPRIDYVINISTDTEENIADLVEFMVGDGIINYNGGENWAQHRIDLGFKEPVDIFAWEIGNELDWGGMPLDEYLYKSRRAIDIIKDIDTDGKICMFASTAVWSGNDGTEEWHRGILKELGDRIDYIAVHYYYPDWFIRRADPPINTLKNDILEITGSDRIKIYYSEQAPARTVEKFTKDDNYAYCLPHTIWGATAQAEFYLRKVLDPWVVATTCHSVEQVQTGESVIQTRMVNASCTAIGEIMQSFMNYGVGKLYDSKLDTFGADVDSSIAGGVFEDENGNVNILFTNRNDTANVTVNFEFKENLYRLKHVRKVHGDVKTADNWYREGASWAYDNPDRVEVTEEDITSSEYFSSYTFEPLSVYALQLEKIPVDNKDEIIAEHIKGSFAFGFDCPNVINKGNVSKAESYMQPQISDGVTYITSEMLTQIFGSDIEIYDNGINIECRTAQGTVIFNTENNLVNVENIPSALNVEGKVYLPLRALAERAGYSLTWDDREFIMVYKNGTLSFPNSSWVRNAIYEKLIGG